MSFGDILIYVICFFGIFTALYYALTLYAFKAGFKDPKAKKIYDVSVIVPALNEEQTIAKTLHSLLNLDYPREKLQIIVVDDGSTDSTYQIAKSFDNIEVYTKQNGGKGSALNLGLEKATGELVGALDADSFVDKNALKHIIGYFDDEKVMAVTPSLKVHMPKKFIQKIQMIEYMIGILLRKVFAFLGSLHVTPGPFTIFRKSFFDRYGGYDEHNLTEDIEIALRIQSNHYDIENAIQAEVYTIAPSTLKPLFRQRLRWYVGFIKNVLRYKKLFHPRFGNLGMIVLPSAFFSVFLVIIMLFYQAFMFGNNLVKDIINLYNIGFDITKIFEVNLDPFYFNFGVSGLVTYVSIGIGIIIIIAAKKLASEKDSIKLHYFLYTLVYWMLFGIWWLSAIIVTITRKKISWGHKQS